ncbi:EAL domain-containing protein [Actinoplanes sp. TBRC 11911]|uniref:putative bifunctional diguanylate cyclase/phosphodiesterase n=1 Tax=Actinoplanes sp. TBRC 11911 TaxID=2729386 RepID=UPI00145F4D28|nr:EAL domain-containing protein [Actinoplanes sp. TBRC 11911]NMO50120.1 EAL domain-containing protein [Actinoplanes sp. TBRC 11911]
MNVRQKLLGGLLGFLALLVLTGGVVLHAAGQSARLAAVTEAEQVARGIVKDIVAGPQLSGGGSLLDDPPALTAYLNRLHDVQERDIVVVDRRKIIQADAVPANVGQPFDHDLDNQVGKTILDGKVRTFVETSADYPDGIKQVVVPLSGETGTTAGAVILEYTPIYDQMMARTSGARTTMIVAGVVCIVLVLLLGLTAAESVTRRIRSLTRAVENIGDGDYAQRVNSGGRDEISQLGAAFNDMAERLERSAHEILAKEYTDSILDSAGEGICGVDAQDRITFANTAAGRITGLGVEGLLERDASAVLPDDDRRAGDSAEREGLLQRPDGTSVRVACTVSPIAKNGTPAGAVIMLRDVTRQRALEHDLRHQATHDALTGLPNRVLLHEHIGGVAAAGQTGAALLLIDLDRFKEVNDTLGHHYGDQLLIEVARRVQSLLRVGELVARLGGDEFAVLLPGLTDENDVASVAARIHDALDEPFPLGGINLTVGGSIGAALCPQHGTTADELLQRADIAMYAAKSSHRGYMLFNASQDSSDPRKLTLASDLRHGIEHGQLLLHYQPKVDAQTGALLGAEALVRWQHPEHGMIRPDEFIPLAEHTGLITPLTTFVLDTALQQCHSWLEGGHRIPVAVNISTHRLLDLNFPTEVSNQLARWQVPAALLTLEITESAIMADPERALLVVQQLHDLEIHLSIDDFGTGYSSMAYLKNLPVHELKIDRSFVSNMTTNERDAVIVRSTVELGRNLGLKVIAEGVEDSETWTELDAVGCHAIQGYYVSRPVTPDAFQEWLDRQATPAAPLLGA